MQRAVRVKELSQDHASSQEGSGLYPCSPMLITTTMYWIYSLILKKFLHCCLRILVEMEIFMTLIAREIGNRLRNLKNEWGTSLFHCIFKYYHIQIKQRTENLFQLHGISQENSSWESQLPTARPLVFEPRMQGPAVLSAFLTQLVDKEEAQLIFQNAI